MLLQFVTLMPETLFTSTAFPMAFRCAMAGLTVVHSDIIFASLDFFRSILTHDCMEPVTAATPSKFATWSSSVRDTMSKEGFQFVGCILNGLVGEFPEDAAATVVSIFRALVHMWPNQLLTWLPPVLEQLPVTSVPNEAKTQFLQEVTV